jgi:hypothetical protein
MRSFLPVSILILLISQSVCAQIKSENSSVEVISSKWLKSRQKSDNPDNQIITPAQSALTPANKNFERNRRVNDLPGTPDRNAETIEARSAALEKNVQESRNPKSSPVDGFLYQAKIHNAGAKTIEVLFWEYQFTERANPANVVSRQFLCGVNIKADKEKDLSVFSTFSPSDQISLNSLDNKPENLFDEKILINRVEYADGTIWQRIGWSYANMKPAINRVLQTPWGTEMCRKL